MRRCTRCGKAFVPSTNGGRPRKRCDECRTPHEKIDGSVWRAMRRLVLAEEPLCAVVGCGEPSTEVDHIVPLSAGGSSERDNLQGMCRAHNAAKGASTSLLVVEVGGQCRCGAMKPPEWKRCTACEFFGVDDGER